MGKSKTSNKRRSTESKIVRFPEGQIVGRLENGTPVSTINVMQSV